MHVETRKDVVNVPLIFSMLAQLLRGLERA